MVNDIMNIDIQEVKVLLMVTILQGSHMITLLPRGVLLTIHGACSLSNCPCPLTTAEDHTILALSPTSNINLNNNSSAFK